ncbi:MAG: phycobilisome rod-core linker polypeptide [Cyanobacteria bacterium P01_H01_bin.26]
MVSTFTKPVVRSGTGAGTRPLDDFNETAPVQLWPNDSSEVVEAAIRAVYKQVLGNAYVMESERLTVPESQLRRGELSVREFVRQVAKSELYRSRFAENCYRYRTIELNFKHLLGRAPQNFDEMKAHSAILDTVGYDADIDSYIDSDDYHNAFGEHTVPYYRGHQTMLGQTMLGFTNMLQLLGGASSSDKVANAPQLTRALIRNAPYGVDKVRHGQEILADVFRATIAKSTPASKAVTSPVQDDQDAEIAKLRAQLATLRPAATIGAAVLRRGQQPGSDGLGTPDGKATLIERLQGELMAARSLATIGEARLNKWRQRSLR